MEKSYFYMACTKLANDIHCEDNIDAQGFLTSYYDKFKGISNTRFAEITNYLAMNWKFRKFPSIAEFNDALKLTVKEPAFNYEYGKRDPEYSKEMHRVLWAFSQMDKIRKQVIPNFDGNITVKTCETMYSFYNKMCEQGKVFSAETEKWIDKRNAITGDYFNPVEFGFPV